MDDHNIVDHCLEQLHAAGWSVGDTAFVTEAGTLSWLVYGTNGENVVRAEGETRVALRVYTENELPADWDLTQNNLGIAYADIPTGDRAENLRRAIEHYEAALRVYTE